MNFPINWRRSAREIFTQLTRSVLIFHHEINQRAINSAAPGESVMTFYFKCLLDVLENTLASIFQVMKIKFVQDDKFNFSELINKSDVK